MHPTELAYCKDDFVKYMIARAGNSPVPFVIHMDHGDSIESIMRAVHVGFTSVMIDGSALPFEENIAKTAEVVNYCHMVGVSVEGELGTIGDTGTSIEGGMTEVIYTNPEDAKKFVEQNLALIRSPLPSAPATACIPRASPRSCAWTCSRRSPRSLTSRSCSTVVRATPTARSPRPCVWASRR